MKSVECPCCLGMKEIIKDGKKLEPCHLCKGNGNVNEELARDFIASINVIIDDEDPFFNT